MFTGNGERGASRADVLAFEFEMGLFPVALDEEKGKGIDLAPKLIPADVFDKRAVDRGQVVFHDVSFIEATPRYAKGKSAKDKLTITIELTDFEERWTGGYIFENEWQSFRTRQNRKLELTTVEHAHQLPGRYTVAVKVIDIFGNNTMTLVPVNVG